MRGGSKASDLVMETNPKLCDEPQSVVNVGAEIPGNVNDLSLYRTTGGGKRRTNKKRKSIKRRNSSKRRSIKRRNSSKRKSIKRRGRKLRGGFKAGNKEESCCGCQKGGKLNKLNKRNRRSNKRKNRRTNSIRSDRKYKGGGSSDWRSTVYSRGPVNTTNMSPEQFRMFTQSEFMPNEALRAASFTKN